MIPGRKRAVVLAIAILGAGAAWVATRRPLPLQSAPPNDGLTRVPGVVHVHTTRSDGGGTPEEVAASAKRAGLAFVAITDHNNLDAKDAEGYRDGVLVIVGAEISTTAGHILALGIPDPVFRFSGDARDALDDVRDLGGVAFAAHPESPREDFRFTGDALPGAWGLELLNGDSQWREAGWLSLARALALYAFNPRHALLQSLTPPTAALARWDALLVRRDVAAIAGADAHARVPIGKTRSFRFPSYESLFGLVRQYAVLERPLSGDAKADSRAIVEALGRGRSYVGLDGLADASGFSFVAQDGDRRIPMGDTAAPAAGLRLRTGGALPAGTRVRLLKDGKLLAENVGSIEAVAPEPGVYRVEAYVPGSALPFILSNPIYVFDGTEAAARAARAAFPPEPEPPKAELLVGGFETGHDPSSEAAGTAPMRFALGIPTAANPSPFVALVSWGKRDFRGRRGLVFAVESDGVYRVQVQVRDENPASADEGTEWWFASVKTAPERRRVAIPFERLRSINPKTDGRLDLDKVRAIVFVIDRGSLKPGTRGTLTVQDAGVY